MKLGATAAAASLLAAGVMPGAHAALTDNVATSPTAMALGNAVTADPPGIDSIHFNPAGLARLSGNWKSDSLTIASIRVNANFHQPDDFNIGGWKEDPLDGTSTGRVRQRLALPVFGLLNPRLPALVGPGLGFSFNKPDSPFTFGTASYVTQGMSLDRTEPDDPARFNGKVVSLLRLVLASPAVGYKVSDTLRIGASVPIAHSSFYVNTDMRAPNVLLGMVGQVQQAWCPNEGGQLIDTLTVGLCGGGPEGRINPFKRAANMDLSLRSPVDPTINLGVLWEPRDWLALGFVYQGGSKTKYNGKYKFTVDPMLRRFVEGMYSSLLGPIVGAITAMPPSIPEVQAGNVTAVIPFPARVQLGMKLKPSRYFQFNVDANYQKWASWDYMTLQFDQSIALLEAMRLFGQADSTKLVLPRHLRSVWHFGYGVQSQVSEKVTLRMGYEPRKSSIPSNQLDLMATLPDTKIYSLGFSYKLNNDSDISVTGSYMKGDFNNPANSSCNLNCDNLLNVVYNPYAGLDVKGAFRVRYFGLTYKTRF